MNQEHLDQIGNTHATVDNWTDKQWNRYYSITYRKIVSSALITQQVEKGTVLDVGTSHGDWFSFLKENGFKKIYGVEIDPSRAMLAKSHGYAEVFNCDAADTPLSPLSIDAAISNDVFVHILKIEDKIKVIKRIEELLKPGGCFIFNHTSVSAYYEQKEYRVEKYCSYISLNEILNIIRDNTKLKVVDIKPSYWHWRHNKTPKLIALLRRGINLPFIPALLNLVDRVYTSHYLPLEQADAFYLVLKK